MSGKVLTDSTNGTVAIGDKPVRRLGFGAMRISGARNADGVRDRSEAIALVRAVVDRGVTLLDAANIYGYGECEEIIAEALFPYPEHLLVATKAGFEPGKLLPGMRSLPPLGRPEHIKAECEKSLRRLRIDCIELYQVHVPDPAVPYADTVGAFVELRDQGKVRHIGVSNVNEEQLAIARSSCDVVSVQNRYNPGVRGSDAVLALCEREGIAFLPHSPGIFAETAAAAVLADIGTAHGAAPQQVSIAWLLAKSPVMIPIPGTTKIAHAMENVDAAFLRLSGEELARIAHLNSPSGAPASGLWSGCSRDPRPCPGSCSSTTVRIENLIFKWGAIMGDKIWANSGDSHFIEPETLFIDNLPADLAERMPRSVKDPDGQWETVYVDGQVFRRKMPRPETLPSTSSDTADPKHLERPHGGAAGTGRDVAARLADLDDEGVWAELTFPSLGIWSFNIQDPKLAKAGAQVLNDWALEMQSKSPRFVCTAALPLLDVDDAIAELHRVAHALKAVSLPAKPSLDGPSWTHERWDPLWDALNEAGTVVAFHIGTEPHTPDKRTGVIHHGRGGAVMNYTETTFGGQRAACMMVASGALDIRPNLKVIVSEGGSGWVPFMADRLDEAYRQHAAAVLPKLTRLPGEILYSQVYASFQHDYRSSVMAMTVGGYQNSVWGSDYPHYEGTWGHTQKTLHELFDDAPDAVSHRIRIGAFQELFPHVPAPPA